jgi:hypothetical protein
MEKMESINNTNAQITSASINKSEEDRKMKPQPIPCFVKASKTTKCQNVISGQKPETETDIIPHSKANQLTISQNDDETNVEHEQEYFNWQKSSETFQLENDIQKKMKCIAKRLSNQSSTSGANNSSPGHQTKEPFLNCSKCGDIFLEEIYLTDHINFVHQVKIFFFPNLIMLLLL